MKHLLLTTIAAVVLVGCCTPAPGISIHDAVKEGKIDVVKQRLEAGTDVNAKDEKGWAPLHFMAVAGNKEIAELLIANGAEVNAKDKFGKTPLDSAIKDKHTETAALLRKHGGKTGEELEAEGN